MQSTVLIENPVPGGRRLISLKRATKHVARGQAVWVIPQRRIRFTDESNAALKLGYDCAANNGLATLSELRNLPMVQPAKILRLKKSKRSTVRSS